jgi:hypothetical protein
VRAFWFTHVAHQGLRYQQIMRLDIASLMMHTTPGSEFVAKLCKRNARWDRSVNSYSAAFGVWAAEIVVKHSAMPNVVDVLKRVTQFAGDPNSLLAVAAHSGAPYLQDAIAKMVKPGVIAATSQPYRALVVLGVALSQLCFAYNMAPPLELPTRALQHAGDRQPPLPVVMPFSDPRRQFAPLLGHDALRPLEEHDVLCVPRQVVQFRCAAADAGDLGPHVAVVPGEVWAHPSHWQRVVDLIQKTSMVHGARLCIFLGGLECPFGFVRQLALLDERHAAGLELPDDMDCCGAPISVPAGVWSTCPIEVSSACNASAIYNLKPTDRVLVLNALQVLPCVLEHLVAPGRLAHCCLALGALPPKLIRLAPITRLTAILEAHAAAATAATAPPEERKARCDAATGIPCNASALEAIGSTLFSRSAARLDSAGFTSRRMDDGTYSRPFLHIAGVLGLTVKLADLLFLPRMVHACARHKCTVLLDPEVDKGTMKWVDSAWGDFHCVFTQTSNSASAADQTLRGPTLQAPWMACFSDDGPVVAHQLRDEK